MSPREHDSTITSSKATERSGWHSPESMRRNIKNKKGKGIKRVLAHFFLAGAVFSVLSFFLPPNLGSFFLNRKRTMTTMITANIPP